MNILLIVFILGVILFINKIINFKKNKSKNLFKFKTKLLSKESSIEKIFSRDNEKTSSDPIINIKIGVYDNEETIRNKSNIHRARLSKFKKSKLNGEIIYVEKDQRLFKYVNGKKKYI